MYILIRDNFIFYVKGRVIMRLWLIWSMVFCSGVACVFVALLVDNSIIRFLVVTFFVFSSYFCYWKLMSKKDCNCKNKKNYIKVLQKTGEPLHIAGFTVPPYIWTIVEERKVQFAIIRDFRWTSSLSDGVLCFELG